MATDVFLTGGMFTPVPFTTGAGPLILRTQEQRRYMMIVNQDATNTMFLGIGYVPTITGAGLSNGLPIYPNGRYYESVIAPWNDLYIVSSVAGLVGIAFFIFD